MSKKIVEVEERLYDTVWAGQHRAYEAIDHAEAALMRFMDMTTAGIDVDGELVKVYQSYELRGKLEISQYGNEYDIEKAKRVLQKVMFQRWIEMRKKEHNAEFEEQEREVNERMGKELTKMRLHQAQMEEEAMAKHDEAEDHRLAAEYCEEQAEELAEKARTEKTAGDIFQEMLNQRRNEIRAKMW